MAIRVDHGVGPVVPAVAYGSGMMRGRQRYGAQAARFAEAALGRRRQDEERMARLALDQRRQGLAEFRAVSDAFNRNVSNQTARIAAEGRNRYYDRQQEIRLQQPSDLEMLSARNQLEQQGDMFSDGSQILGEYRKRNLTPEGRQRLAELEAQFRGIQSGSFRPGQKQEMLRKWFSNVNSAGLDSYVEPEQTIQDVMARDIAQGPDGNWYTLDRYGALKQTQSQDSSGAADMTGGMLSPQEQFQSTYAGDPESFRKALAEAEKAVRERKAANWTGEDAPAEPTPEEIQAELMRPFEVYSQMTQVRGEDGDITMPSKKIMDQIEKNSMTTEPTSPSDAIPDFEAMEKSADGQSSRLEVQRLRDFYNGTEDEIVRGAISVLASPVEPSKEDVLRAIAALKRQGVDIDEILNPPKKMLPGRGRSKSFRPPLGTRLY